MPIDDSDVDIFLEHHGIKGMQWGVRKANKQARRDSRAQKFKDKAAGYKTEIATVKAGNNPYKYRELRRLNEKKRTAEENARRKSEGKLSINQKRVAVGAGVAVGILAAAGTAHSINTGNARRLVANGKNFVLRRNENPWKVNPELARKDLSPDEIMSKVVKNINPDYGAYGTKQNCRRATFAYEMRRRGNDVAATRTRNGVGQEVTGYYNATHPGVNNVAPGRSGMVTRMIAEARGKTKGRATPFTDEVNMVNKTGIFDHPSAPGMLFDHLAQQPNGSRGEVGMTWAGGGGHSMAYEIINHRPVIFDTQTGKKYESPMDMQRELRSMANVGFNRLDDIPLNSDFLKRWVKSA